MNYKIKNPTVRKVKNRGFTPVTWHSNQHGFVSGWIYKEGTKWLHFYSSGTGRKRLPKSERQHMRTL